MGARKGMWGTLGMGSNWGKDCGRGGAGGGGGGGSDNPIPGAVSARWCGGPVEKVVLVTKGAVGESTVRGVRVR